MQAIYAVWVRLLGWMVTHTNADFFVASRERMAALANSLGRQDDFVSRSGFLDSTGYHAKRKLLRGVTDALERFGAACEDMTGAV